MEPPSGSFAHLELGTKVFQGARPFVFAFRAESMTCAFFPFLGSGIPVGMLLPESPPFVQLLKWAPSTISAFWDRSTKNLDMATYFLEIVKWGLLSPHPLVSSRAAPLARRGTRQAMLQRGACRRVDGPGALQWIDFATLKGNPNLHDLLTLTTGIGPRAGGLLARPEQPERRAPIDQVDAVCSRRCLLQDTRIAQNRPYRASNARIPPQDCLAGVLA